MPALKLAPQRQSWLTAQPLECSDQSQAHVVCVLEASPAVARRWTPTAAAVEETGPVSPTLARPSSIVIGGAFVGAFLGLLILLLLIWCCCCDHRRGRNGSDKNSSKSSSTSSSTRSPPSSPRAPPPPPPPPAPVRPPPSARGSVPVVTSPSRPPPGSAPGSAPGPTPGPGPGPTSGPTSGPSSGLIRRPPPIAAAPSVRSIATRFGLQAPPAPFNRGYIPEPARLQAPEHETAAPQVLYEAVSSQAAAQAVPQAASQAAPQEASQAYFQAAQEYYQLPVEPSRPSKHPHRSATFRREEDGNYTLRKSRGPPRPERHPRVELDSMSGSSGSHRERVFSPLSVSKLHILNHDSLPLAHKAWRRCYS